MLTNIFYDCQGTNRMIIRKLNERRRKKTINELKKDKRKQK